MKHIIFCCVIKTCILRLAYSILSRYGPVLILYTEIKLGHELQMDLDGVIVSFAENLWNATMTHLRERVIGQSAQCLI